MNSRKSRLSSILAALGFLLAACGGSGSPNPPPASISVALSPAPPTSMVVATTSTLTAVVSNDSAAAGVAWSVSCSSAPCGSFSPATTPGNTSSSVYTAPATVPSGGTVVVTATSVSDSTKSASATITITATASVSVEISNPPATLVTSVTSNLTAIVSEDSAAAGVTWSVTCGSEACGSFNPTTSPGNTATTVYTAPSAVPTGGTVTVKATSVTDATKSATATITITTAPPAVIADGTYVYHLEGEDVSGGPYFLAGAFTVRNGVISAGEQDYIDYNQGGSNTLVAANCSLTLESSGNIQIVLDTGGGSNGPGVNGIETFRGTLVSPTRALITEFDEFASGNGSLDLQTGAAAPSGSYAFNLGGLDGSSESQLLVIGGILSINGTSLNTTNSVFDYSDGGSIGQGQSFQSGALSAPDSFGRFTMTLTPSQSSDSSFGLIGYIVGPNRIQFVENIEDQLQATLGGTALGQAKNNTFSAADVSGSSYAFIASGADANGLASFGGAFSLNANGSVSGVLAYNDGANRQGPQITGGSWTIDPNGRVTLSNVMLDNANIGNGPYTFQLYVDGNGNALELGIDDIQGSTGPSFAQQGDPLTAGDFAVSTQGYTGFDGTPLVWGAVGPVTLDSSLNWSGFTDFNVFSGSPYPNMQLTGITQEDGLFEINGLSAITNPPGPCSFGYYPVSTTKVLAIQLNDFQLGTMILEGRASAEQQQAKQQPKK